jgi:hypothetical protein
MWEDEKNKQGGRWLVNTNRNQRTELDRIWLETVKYLLFKIVYYILYKKNFIKSNFINANCVNHEIKLKQSNFERNAKGFEYFSLQIRNIEN